MPRPKPSTTDLESSISAKEFLWDSGENIRAHSYIAPLILRRLKEQKAKRVLDIGCGNGAFSQTLMAAGYEVVGIEPSESGIAQAVQRGGDFRCRSVDDPLPSDLIGTFDAVIAIEVIEHLLFPRNIFFRAKEAMAGSGGVLLVTTPYHGYCKNLALALVNGFDQHWHPLRDFGHIKFFSPATLTALFLEMGVDVKSVDRVGRLPVLAKSMIVSGLVKGA